MYENFMDRRGFLMSAGAAAASPSAPTQGPSVHVQEFGAVGDGVADDTAAIQAALDAIGGSGGGVVSLPRGTFRVTSQLSVRSGTTLRGVGSTSVIQADIGATDDSIVKMEAVSDVRISDLALDGMQLETKGFWIVDCARISITRCRLRAVEAQGVNNALLKIDYNNDGAWIVDNAFECPHLAILLQERSGGTIANTIIQGNQVLVTGPNFPGQGTGSEAIKIDKNCVGTVITGNTVRGSSLSCVTLEEGCTDTIVQGNTFYPADQSGIRVEDGQSDTPMQGVLISNNVIRGGVTGIYFGQENSARDVEVQGNQCLGQSDVGILAWGVGVAVTGNSCDSGIRARGRGVSVIGNRISGGDLEVTTVTDGDVVGNVIHGGRIAIGRSTNVIATGNSIRAPREEGVAGIFVSGSNPSSTGIRLAGNVSDPLDSDCPWGIYVDAGADDVSIRGNTVNGAMGEVFVDARATAVLNADAKPAYAAQSESIRRVVDSDSSREEVAEALATLIQDLQGLGLLGRP